MVKPVPHRTRAGTYTTFLRRYAPIELPDGSITRDWRDPLVMACFDRGMADDGIRLVWTIVDGDSGDRCYLVPGFATVNYVARVLCQKPWPDNEELLPGYLW